MTQSQRGITNKAVLIATETGNIVSLPRIFLDPRRKLIPEPTDREEGIMPYEPELKLPSNFNINYNMSMEAVSEFHVAMSGLESTCIDAVFLGRTHFCTINLKNDNFSVRKLTFTLWPRKPGLSENYLFLIFFIKKGRNRQYKSLLNRDTFVYNQAYIFFIIEL